MNALADRLNLSTPILLLVLVLAVVQFVLQFYSLIDLWRRDRVAELPKWVWVLVIVLGNLLGALLYLGVGRKTPPEIIEQPISHRDKANHIQDALDDLYGPVQ